MRATLSILCVLLTLLAAGASISRETDHDESDPDVDGEVVRIRTHLGSVLAELRAADVSGLTAEQKNARREALGWLDEYRAAGVFPHNHVRPERVPVFIDPHDTPCAVGYLMLRSGEEELVADIVREANLARIPELRSDPRLGAWLASRGLTVEEAARIQPSYGPREEPDPTPYAAETVAAAAATTATTAFIWLAEPVVSGTVEWPSALSILSLTAHGILLGAAAGDDEESPGWETGVNVLGVVANVMTLLRRSDQIRESRQLSAAPIALPYVGAARGALIAGLTVRH